MSHGHGFDRRSGQGFVEVKCLLAGYPEYVRDALSHEAVDENI
jgi:hypothetical protein